MNPADRERQLLPPGAPPAGVAAEGGSSLDPRSPDDDAHELHALHWIFVGGQGLRAGWSVLIAVILYRLFTPVLGAMAVGFYPAAANPGFSPGTAIFGELVPLLAMLTAGVLLTRIEQRKILDYNLTGPRRSLRFVSGAAAGFVALSILVGALALGGWLHFGPIALSGADVFRIGALWACAFLLVGCVEEGIFRCFMQFTLTRGVNFWWALGIISVACLDLLLRSQGAMGIIAFVWLNPLPEIRGNSIWGVYAVAVLGLVPCLMLHLKKAEGSGFWQAAWVTSTLFGFIHTGNGGETWIGILAAAAIGFVFVVSVWVTGSAWWAIGCHAAWDWAETYFYGTADSGLQAQGHYLTTSPAGSVLWSGGSDGPEGSVLVLGVILMLLLALVLIYGRRKPAALSTVAAEPAAG
jgi:membrane protease YdiL (CAAX protease family)